MKSRIAITMTMGLMMASFASAQQLEVRETRFVPVESRAFPHALEQTATRVDQFVNNSDAEPDPYLLYPVAGVFDQDVFIPYYVDLDPTSGSLAFNCSHLSYNGNTGEDPYIRSFKEEDIGVPVFAAIGGTVIEAHGGEPDHNITSFGSAVSNYVAILHGSNQRTDYVHLRSDLLVKVGDVVTAGTQIGWIGSSGPSTWPHLHFESRFNGGVYEPLAGPCRAGRSYFSQQPAVSTAPFVSSVVLSSSSFDNLPLPPQDSAVPTGTFVKGVRTIYLRADLGNLFSASNYSLQLHSPTGAILQASGSFSQYQQEFLSAYFGIGANLDTVGTWTLTLIIDGATVATVPFTVVESPTQIINRPPNGITAAIDPVSASGVAVCRANNGVIADPDYDVLTYQYVWTVNGVTVRTVTSAAKTDALAQQYATLHAGISCTITASDGRLQTQPSQAFVDVSLGKHHRRVVGR